jgi:ABC-type multidrug transport system fused ATPase/permease subunit
MGYPRKQCWDVIRGLFTLIAGSLATFATPGLIGVVIDAMTRRDQDDINFYCFWMGVICIFSAVCSGIRAYTFNTLYEKIARMIRYDLFN